MKLEIAPDVLIRTIEGESLILNIPAQEYLGLDPVGTRMWQLLTAGGSVADALQALLFEYEVEPDVLRSDLDEFVGKLIAAGLLRVSAES
jgi:hypothetical protein